MPVDQLPERFGVPVAGAAGQREVGVDGGLGGSRRRRDRGTCGHRIVGGRHEQHAEADRDAAEVQPGQGQCGGTHARVRRSVPAPGFQPPG